MRPFDRWKDYRERATLRTSGLTSAQLKDMPLSNLAVHIKRTSRYELSSGVINALGVLLRSEKDRTVEALATLLALTTSWKGREAELVRSELKERLKTYHD